MTDQKRVFSGIQPSGNLHLGNYIGAISQWLALQENYQCFFSIVDLHAITVPQDPQKLAEKVKELAALYLACGLNPKKSVIFIQSHNPDHTSLTWILDCLATIGQLERMTQYKEKSSRGQAGVGLFNYPVLMAADILLYQTDLVPVGEDQKQHVELTRDLAEKFNQRFGQTFKLPQTKTLSHGARIMSLKEPTKKMSKSEQDAKGTIDLLDSPDQVAAKIASSVTDSGQEIKSDPGKPGITNLLTIYSAVSQENLSQLEEKYQQKSYRQFKIDLAQAVNDFLAPIQKQYRQWRQNEDQLEKILNQGRNEAREISQITLSRVYQKIGLK